MLVTDDFVQTLVALSYLGSFSHLGSLKWPRLATRIPLRLLSSMVAQSLKQKWLWRATQSSWHIGRPTALPSFSVQSGKAYLQSRDCRERKSSSYEEGRCILMT